MYYHPFTCSGQPPSPRCYCHTHRAVYKLSLGKAPVPRTYFPPPLVLFKYSRIELLRFPLLSFSLLYPVHSHILSKFVVFMFASLSNLDFFEAVRSLQVLWVFILGLCIIKGVVIT